MINKIKLILVKLILVRIFPVILLILAGGPPAV